MQAPIAAWSMAFPISMSLGCINMHKLIWDKGHSTLEHLRLFATIKSIKSFSKLDQGPIETNERSWRARRNTGQMLSTKCSLFDRIFLVQSLNSPCVRARARVKPWRNHASRTLKRHPFVSRSFALQNAQENAILYRKFIRRMKYLSVRETRYISRELRELPVRCGTSG